MWAGIAGSAIPDGGYEVAISIHDSVYNTDFASTIISGKAVQAKDIEEHCIQALRDFENEHICKFLGAGVTLALLRDVSSIPNVLSIS